MKLLPVSDLLLGEQANSLVSNRIWRLLRKLMGNGFPIAAIAGKREIMQQLSPSGKVYQASTYAGNPACVSASIATIEVLGEAKNEIYPKVARTCDNIVSGMKRCIEEFQT